MPLMVENVMDLRHAAVKLVDDLTAKYLSITKTGQLSREQGIYTLVEDLLHEVGSIAEDETRKALRKGQVAP